MKRSDPSWYFEGYHAETVTGKNGRGKTVYRYDGPLWDPEWTGAQLRRAKIAYGGDLLLFTLLWLWLNLWPADGGYMIWVGGFSFCVIAPLMFLWIGMVHFLREHPPWTKREYWTGWRRMFRSAVPVAALADAAAAGEAVYLMLYSERFGANLTYFLGLIACGVLVTLLAIELGRKRPRLIEEEPH